MPILHIEHPVPDFNAWKKSFDDDPMDRKGSGVRRYRILRATDDPNCVIIDLEFDSTSQAEALHASLRELWARVQPEGLVGGTTARIVEVIETKEL
jgi:hypothetical protein